MQQSDGGFKHKPVLLREVLEALKPAPGKIMVDCTLGGAGHSRALLEKLLPGGRLIAFDQDRDAIRAAHKALQHLGPENYTIVHSNFLHLQEHLQTLQIEEIDGLLYDLGVSSFQLDQAERGFSYQHDAALDMRMDQTAPLTAETLVNEASEAELARIIKEYGEERWAGRIAGFIAREREMSAIRTTGQLVDIIKKAIPSSARREGPHPAKRTFQALRIAVNKELEILEQSLLEGIEVLRTGGRMAVITFHSLEDRIVKKVFQSQAQGCVCPKNIPVCTCRREPVVRVLTSKPLLPGEKELLDNPRARSAKLRIVEKLPRSKVEKR